MLEQIVEMLGEGQKRQGWRDTERDFKATRDPQMKISLPQLKFLEDDDSQRRDS